MYLAGGGYFTYYKYSLDPKEDLDKKSFIGNTACFSVLMNHCGFADPNDIEYLKVAVYIFKDKSFGDKHSYNHCCFYNKKELGSILLSARNLVNFKYNIKDIDDYLFRDTYHHSVHIVNLEFRHVSILQFKYVLTWLRYTYEYPYNVALLEATRLHKLKQYSKYTLPNLFQATSYALPFSFGTGHACAAGSEFVSTKDMKSKLSAKYSSRLNNLYGPSKRNSYDSDGGLIPSSEISKESEFWEEGLKFEDRLPYYDKAINLLNTLNKPK